MSPLIFQQGYQFILALKMSRCCEYQNCNFEIDCQVLRNLLEKSDGWNSFCWEFSF